MTVDFRIEPLSGRLAGEIEILAEDHGREFTYWREAKGKVDIDWAYYFAVQARGTLAIATAREGDKLVGYFVFEIGTLPHYKGCSQVRDDTFYLAPEHRGSTTGFRFICFAVAQMEKAPAKIIKVVNKVKADYRDMWAKLGFEPEEIHYTKVNPNG